MTLAYNDADQLLRETYVGGPLAGLAVTNGYDSVLRRTAVAALNASTLLAYSYDAASRLQTVSDGLGNTATYSYPADSPLVSQIVFANNGTTRMTTTKQYDALNRLTSISSAMGPSAIGYSYACNSASQRTSVTTADGCYWVYQYDALGQVTSGSKYWSGGTPVAGRQFQYQCDTIGNRTGRDTGGDQNGANLHHAGYTPDPANLNQYTSRDVPGFVQSLGTASPSAGVFLWSANAAYAQAVGQGACFRAELPVANATGAAWVPLTNIALLPGGSNADVEATPGGIAAEPDLTHAAKPDPVATYLF